VREQNFAVHATSYASAVGKQAPNNRDEGYLISIVDERIGSVAGASSVRIACIILAWLRTRPDLTIAARD
jgi:hypothetical protein